MQVNVSWPNVHGRPSWWWGQVTSTNPLEVAPDGQADPVQMAGSLVGGLTVGDRVMVQVTGHAATVLGKNYTY